MHNVLRRSRQIVVLTAMLGMSIVTGPAAAAPPPDPACLSNLFPPPDNSLNLRYGVDERIIGPPGCLEALAGERWVRAVPPWVATDAGIAAFSQNFVSARWVIDAGTPQEFTVTAGPDSLRGPFDVPSGPFVGKKFVAPVSSPMRPLSMGEHTNIVYVTMSAETCNGLGGVDEICLPARESQYASPFFPLPVDHLVPAAVFDFVARTP
ncbi:hypothetical protein FXW78_29965 [Rhodococcus opacus]|nr:hypothetical protein [Rhodococcus opacus]